ncbi:MAG TPA: family 1 glycosylhydrolase [Anaerolineales bacterium]
MPQATFHFPAGFLWGTATASHQVEGNNTNNNWAAWEAEEGRILNGDKAGRACDWWGGRWKEDFDRAAEAGQNAHRLSIEWSRIQPAENRWDENALDYYREMLRGLSERGMTPLVTLHHFTDPLWLTEQGGWENEQVAEKFVAYTRKVVEALKEYATLWVTINEPMVYVYSGYMDTAFPPGKRDPDAAFVVMRNMLRAHAGAYRAIHKIQPAARVGVAQHFRNFRPARPGFPPDVWMVNFISNNVNYSFVNALANGRFSFLAKGGHLPELIGTQDFVGVNYYTTELITFRPLNLGNFFHSRAYAPDAELSGTGYLANVPSGFMEVMRWSTRFQLPILITENGVEDAEDHVRPSYLLQHIHQVWRALNFNWPVKGYFHWSLVDNFEWERGWSQCFGLWGLDVDSQRRIHRPSVDLYGEICKANAISYEMVEKYAPQLIGKLFPG